MSCGWLFCAGGYYRYDQGFTPEFAGRERFGGQIVHPQHWPEDLDYSGKRVVVIGSGATAVTLIPAMAGTAAHVTMLQRSPTYVMPLPSEDAIANGLPALSGAKPAYAITRRKNVAQQRAIYRLCQRYPRTAQRVIRYLNARQLPEGYPVDEHFKPAYNPWDQRLCVVPDGDLFKAIRDGTPRWSPTGSTPSPSGESGCESGRELEADIIVTATGLNLQAFGGITLTVDGVEVNVADQVAFKGIMLDGVPNFAFTFGYTNSSWTLKVGLVGDHFTRLLAYMDANDHQICYPQISDPHMETLPLLGIGAGYVKRSIDQFPRQGDGGPWRMTMDYKADVKLLRDGPVEDENLRFATASRVDTRDLVLTA